MKLPYTPGFRTWSHGVTRPRMPIVTTRKSGVYHLLLVYLVHFEVRINLLITECFVSCFVLTYFICATRDRIH